MLRVNNNYGIDSIAEIPSFSGIDPIGPQFICSETSDLTDEHVSRPVSMGILGPRYIASRS